MSFMFFDTIDYSLTCLDFLTPTTTTTTTTITPPGLLNSDQCDQVWRNFATLAIFLKYLANVWRVNITFGNILNLFWHISMLLGKFCLLQMFKFASSDQNTQS